MKTLRMKITGTVQGVFFRKFVKDSADELNVKGYTRNLEDGSVEILVEGVEENVNEFVSMCEKGPGHANIKKVDVEEIRHQGFEKFKISSL